MEDKIELEGIFENGYGFISKKIMQDKDLSLCSKGIYAYFCSFSGKGNDSFPSRKKICHDLDISNDTLGKYLKELQDKNYIQVYHEKNNGKFMNNVYKICMSIPCPKISYTVNSYTEKSYTENLDTNNNNNNNNINNNNNNNNSSFYNNDDNYDSNGEEGKKDIYEFIEENYCRTLAPVELEKIKSWKEYFSEDMIKYAFELSIIKNARNFSYVGTILRNWYDNQIKTLDQAKAKANEYNNNKQTKPFKKQQQEEKELPEWFNKTNESEKMTKEEQEEMESLINDLTSW